MWNGDAVGRVQGRRRCRKRKLTQAVHLNPHRKHQLGVTGRATSQTDNDCLLSTGFPDIPAAVAVVAGEDGVGGPLNRVLSEDGSEQDDKGKRLRFESMSRSGGRFRLLPRPAHSQSRPPGQAPHCPQTPARTGSCTVLPPQPDRRSSGCVQYFYILPAIGCEVKVYQSQSVQKGSILFAHSSF